MSTPIDDERDLRRLAISHGDLHEASAFADALARLPMWNGSEARQDVVTREALLTAFVVAYARPFKANDAGDHTARRLYIGELVELTHEQLRIHNHILGLRDKRFAHSDPLPVGLVIAPDRGPERRASMLEPRPPVSPETARQFADLAATVLLAAANRLYSAGIVGITHEW